MAKAVISPSQCREARKLLGWTAADLSRASGVSLFTVRKFETGTLAGGRLAPTLLKRALEGAGVKFAKLEGDDGSVRLGSTSR